MWFFNKKRKKQIEDEDSIFMDLELDFEDEFGKRAENIKNDKEFRDIEDMQYIRTQCELMTEASKYINELKNEYRSVNSYLNDIQIIETLPDKQRDELRRNAKEIVRLLNKRKKMSKEQSLLSDKQNAMFERYEDEFPKALVDLQNDEKYYNAVKHDMRVLEAEKTSLKEDIANCGLRRTNIRNISIISLLAVLAVFIIFIISGQLGSSNGLVLFMVVLLLVALFVLLIFFLQRNNIYRLKLSEKKLARAIRLLNKVRIKYVNISNSLDYQLAKFDVKNSYELSRQYEVFLNERKKIEQYHNSTLELDEALADFNDMLLSLRLYDDSVWSAQITALIDPKEMDEVRRSLNLKRQKLREQIDYNMSRVEEAKNNVMTYVKKHPSKAERIMEIVDSYEEV